MSRRRREHRIWDEQGLVHDFDLYDRNVDIVSAFEFWFTCVEAVAPTVAHFERFPRFTHPDGRPSTPDFTVLFNDGTGMVGEIANLARDDRGVDKLCSQLLRYDSLAALPTGRAGQTGPVSVVDVLYLTPAETGPQANQRIIHDRLRAKSHVYSPRRPPVVMQFFRSSDLFLLQRIADAANGTLCAGRRRGRANFRNWESYNLRPERFAPIKVRRGFMNDPVPALYMATVLMIKVWPSVHGGVTREFQTSVAESSLALRNQYGVGRADDVRSALALLQAAGVAKPGADDAWTITRRQSRGSERDVHRILARAAAGGPRPGGALLPRRSAMPRRPGPGQDSLF